MSAFSDGLLFVNGGDFRGIELELACNRIYYGHYNTSLGTHQGNHGRSIDRTFKNS